MVMGIGGRDMDLTIKDSHKDGADKQQGKDATDFATRHPQHRCPFPKRPTTQTFQMNELPDCGDGALAIRAVVFLATLL